MDLSCRNCHPFPGPTMMVRWRINSLALCLNQSLPHRGLWPRLTQHRGNAPRIRRRPDRLPRLQYARANRLRRRRCEAERSEGLVRSQGMASRKPPKVSVSDLKRTCIRRVRHGAQTPAADVLDYVVCKPMEVTVTLRLLLIS